MKSNHRQGLILLRHFSQATPVPLKLVFLNTHVQVVYFEVTAQKMLSSLELIADFEFWAVGFLFLGLAYGKFLCVPHLGDKSFGCDTRTQLFFLGIVFVAATVEQLWSGIYICVCIYIYIIYRSTLFPDTCAKYEFEEWFTVFAWQVSAWNVCNNFYL